MVKQKLLDELHIKIRRIIAQHLGKNHTLALKNVKNVKNFDRFTHFFQNSYM